MPSHDAAEPAAVPRKERKVAVALSRVHKSKEDHMRRVQRISKSHVSPTPPPSGQLRPMAHARHFDRIEHGQLPPPLSASSEELVEDAVVNESEYRTLHAGHAAKEMSGEEVDDDTSDFSDVKDGADEAYPVRAADIPRAHEQHDHDSGGEVQSHSEGSGDEEQDDYEGDEGAPVLRATQSSLSGRTSVAVSPRSRPIVDRAARNAR
jgi:hypothetical protein